MNRNTGRLVVVGIVVAATIALFLLPVFLANPAAYLHRGETAPGAIDGRLDIPDERFPESGALALTGSWDFFPDEILDPASIAGRDTEGEVDGSLSLPAELDANRYESGTLRLRVALPAGHAGIGGAGSGSTGNGSGGNGSAGNGSGGAAAGSGGGAGSDRGGPAATRLAVKAAYFASANRIFVNGELIAESGRVGGEGSEYRPQYLPILAPFEFASGEMELVFQFANSHHRRVRLNEIYLGSYARLLEMRQRTVIRDSILLGSLILAAAYYGIIFLIHRNEPANLLLGLIAILAAGRLSIVNERILIQLLPEFPPELMMKIGYAPALLLIPLFVMYVSEIFESPSLSAPARYSRYTAIALTLLVALSPVRVYDWVFEYLFVILLAGGAWVIVLLIRHRLLTRARGSGMITGGGVLLLATGVNDLLRELSIIRTPELVSSGLVVFLVLQGILLATRFNEAYRKADTLSRENAQMLENITTLNRDLEQRIRTRTEELERANAQLEKMSQVDPLTGLFNRRALEERYLLARSIHQREQQALSVLMIDVDAFKEFNDNYGHQAGDAALQEVAAVLSQCCHRESDVRARYGGEEFMVLLTNTSGDGAQAVAESIRRAVEAKAIVHLHSPVASVVTVSVGGAVGVPQDAAMSGRLEARSDSQALRSARKSIADDELIRRADRALYRAKDRGRNRVHFDAG